MHGDCRNGRGGTVMIVTVLVACHQYSGIGGAGNIDIVLEAHVWWNRKWFNGEYINSGSAWMGAYGSGVCFE